MESLQGYMLVASPQLRDPNFARTVVLLVQHNEEGAMGLVVNRPTSKTVMELWRDVSEEACDNEQPVYIGGPVPGPLMAVHMNESIAEIQTTSDVFFAAKKQELDALVQQETVPFKIFMGHAGWTAGQLDEEIAEGSWRMAPATAETIFFDGDDLWERVMRSIGRSTLQSMLNIKHIPEDPSLN